MDDTETAVLVTGACKQYGGKDSKMILDHLDMRVEKGMIYGLLGASGCGKTTLLSVIVGSRKLQSGDISVLGNPPGLSAVKKIGYMPQDMALVGEFTVKGAIEHFGWIFGLTSEQINQKFEFLSKLLDLPPENKLIKHLSGGQQRRVSMAVVLVHNPELLILDEPTVGLDPVLRQNIWDYLVKIAKEDKKTIIITTHYIEEARRAHMIGLMRNGKLLSQGSPQYLLDKYNCANIEDVFLLLSSKQQQGRIEAMRNNSEISSVSERRSSVDLTSIEVTNDGQYIEHFKDGSQHSSRINGCHNNGAIQSSQPKTELPKRKTFKERLCFTNKGHAKALMSKNWYRIIRHPGGICFSFFFPVLQITIFFACIGLEPTDTKIGIVNEELGNYSNCREYVKNNPVGGFLEGERDCHFLGLGCKFIGSLSDKLHNQVYYKTEEEAFEDARRGNLNTFLHFRKNFSAALKARMDLGLDVSDIDLDYHEIRVFQDMTSRDIGTIVQREILQGYRDFAKELANTCNESTHAAKLPILFNDPIYGSDRLTYNEFMAPGVMITMVVFLAMSVSTLTIISERTDGVWDRTLVSGVTTTEILVFHTISQSVISIIQMSEVLGMSFLVFKLNCMGDISTVFALVFLQSLVGVSAGILISVVTRTVTESNYVSMGSFYPFLILSGYLWPLEGMPDLLRYFSYFVPTTLAVESAANVMRRGWTIANFHVFKAFLSSFGFLAFFTLVSILHLKYEKK